MKKMILITPLILGLFASFIIFKRMKKSNRKAAYTIGILQTASHPALDAARQGFIEELHSKLGDSIEFITQNAQGSIANAHALAQQFHSNQQLNGFFAIATPAAQAMGSIEKEKPLFIAAVTDPDALGLLNPTTNICGIKDMIDVAAQIEMLTQLIPHAQTVGLLYTSGEANSIALVKQMHKALQAHGLTPIDFAVSQESDMPAVVELACRKADVILAPTDNTVASTIALITSMTLKHKKPLIVSDNLLVSFGALAARGIDYKASGKRAAQIAYMVLIEGKKPYELPIEQAAIEDIIVNKKTLDDLHLTVPESIKDHVTLINE